MVNQAYQLSTLEAEPTKAFFVRMLTRDISLEDAILDLLDNAIDGALRSMPETHRGTEREFHGYWAKIDIKENSFSITDNCGGIPPEKFPYAFKHGRPPAFTDGNLPTVGIYGIGLKRAIYKLGVDAYVATQYRKSACQVPFTSEWMTSDSWTLPVVANNYDFLEDGTRVEIGQLHPDVENIFRNSLADFEGELSNLIAEHYAYLILKGFQVFVNEEIVEGKPIDILSETGDSDSLIQPFYWKKEEENVKIFVAVGFYRPPIRKYEGEADEEENWRSEHSGWTVLCNHRVVAYCDKTILTGWGDKPIPRFHAQFNAIRGIVVFESDDASKLPTTTTKRGIDAGNPIYGEVKNVMKDGLRIFIDSTNKWKEESEESRARLRSEKVKALSLPELRAEANLTLKPNRGGSGGFISRPRLPEPEREERPIWIRFSKERNDIEAVMEYLFGGDEKTPAEVGEACFDQIRKRAK